MQTLKIFLVFYFCSSFIQSDFWFENWPEKSRAMVVTFTILVKIFLLIKDEIINDINEIKLL